MIGRTVIQVAIGFSGSRLSGVSDYQPKWVAQLTVSDHCLAKGMNLLVVAIFGLTWATIVNGKRQNAMRITHGERRGASRSTLGPNFTAKRERAR